MVGPLGHMDKLTLREAWKLTSSSGGGAQGPQIKTRGTKAGGGGASMACYTPYLLSYINTRKVILLTTPQGEAPHLELSYTLSWATLPLADYIICIL